jgi:hypothetical protein
VRVGVGGIGEGVRDTSTTSDSLLVGVALSATGIVGRGVFVGMGVGGMGRGVLVGIGVIVGWLVGDACTGGTGMTLAVGVELGTRLGNTVAVAVADGERVAVHVTDGVIVSVGVLVAVSEAGTTGNGVMVSSYRPDDGV